MQRNLRWTAGVFLAAVTIHGVDHVRRGIGAVTGQVLGAGTAQYVFAVVAVGVIGLP